MDNILLYPRNSDWHNIFSMTDKITKRRLRSDSMFSKDNICKFINSLVSCRPYHMHLMYGHAKLQLSTSQCWCPCNDTLNKWAKKHAHMYFIN